MEATVRISWQVLSTLFSSSTGSIREAYTRALPEDYDQRLSPLFDEWKAQAIAASSLKEGDRVIVFCCGTGNDFHHIQKRVGETGSIVGVDFSPEMLAVARDKINRAGWTNVRLSEADVTQIRLGDGPQFDVGICTLGMSLIPRYQQAYEKLVATVKPGGELVIADLCLASIWRFLFNARVVYRAKEFGGSYRGHRNSRRLFAKMERELTDVRVESFHQGAYRYCVGRKRSEIETT
jgi:ubiquinone/menaquinone biosynthesis C-methylase UbiE